MDWLGDLMNTMENDTEWDDAQKKLDAATAKLEKSLETARANLLEWQSKSYKKNTARWTNEDETFSVSYSAINEKRRARRIYTIAAEIKHLEEKLAKINIDDFLN